MFRIFISSVVLGVCVVVPWVFFARFFNHVNLRFTAGVIRDSVRDGDAEIEDDLLSESWQPHGIWAVLGVGALVALNALLFRWALEMLVNSTWSTGRVTNEGEEREIAVHPGRFYIKRAMDEPMYTVSRSPFLYAKAVLDVISVPAMLYDGLSADEVTYAKELKRAWEKRREAGNFNVTLLHVLTAGLLVLVLAGSELLTAVAYLCGRRNLTDRALKGTYELAMEIRLAPGQYNLKPGTRFAQDLVLRAAGLPHMSLYSSLYPVPKEGLRSKLKKDMGWNSPEKENETERVAISSDQVSNTTVIFIVTKHRNSTARFLMFINPNNRLKAKDVRVKTSIQGGVSEIAIQANMCNDNEDYPDISNPEVDNGQSVNRCEVEEAESLFQTILQRAHFKLIRGGDGLMLRDVPVYTLYPTMLAAMSSSLALLVLVLFAEYLENPGTRAVSKAIDVLCGQAMTSDGLPNAAFSEKASGLSFGVAIRQYRNRSKRDGFFVADSTMNFEEKVREFEKERLSQGRLNKLRDLFVDENVGLITDHHVAAVVAILIRDCNADGQVELFDDGFMIVEENFPGPLQLLSGQVTQQDRRRAVRAVLEHAGILGYLEVTRVDCNYLTKGENAIVTIRGRGKNSSSRMSMDESGAGGPDQQG